MTPWPSITEKTLKSFKLYSFCNTRNESWLTLVKPSSPFPAWDKDATFFTRPEGKGLTFISSGIIWTELRRCSFLSLSLPDFFLFLDGLFESFSSSSSSSAFIKFILKSLSSSSSSFLSFTTPFLNEGDRYLPLLDFSLSLSLIFYIYKTLIMHLILIIY